MWPRFQVTPDEARYSSKYEDPRTNKQRVLRRMYYNELNLNSNMRADSVQFQISRRSRVFGITAAGDIDQFYVELIDSTGEQYTAGRVTLTNLLNGWANNPISFDTSFPIGAGGLDLSARTVATVRTDGPFIQEPNIVLAPNQALNINVTPTNAVTNLDVAYRIGLTLHVYEFPGMPGSPY